MIGADAKGTEKLYRYRPEDFYWTVLETNTTDLNSAERYWIEYYCCKEVGLNKKQKCKTKNAKIKNAKIKNATYGILTTPVAFFY